ncbi:hypothetical protein S83_034944, partial [Arachis hypogaea]
RHFHQSPPERPDCLLLPCRVPDSTIIASSCRRHPASRLQPQLLLAAVAVLASPVTIFLPHVLRQRPASSPSPPSRPESPDSTPPLLL